MWWDDIACLLTYASKRYSEPRIRWKKRKFELRCYEIKTYVDILNKCMDKPFINPYYILDEYLLYFEGLCVIFKDRPKRLEEYIVMKKVVINLMTKIRMFK